MIIDPLLPRAKWLGLVDEYGPSEAILCFPLPWTCARAIVASAYHGANVLFCFSLWQAFTRCVNFWLQTLWGYDNEKCARPSQARSLMRILGHADGRGSARTTVCDVGYGSIMLWIAIFWLGGTCEFGCAVPFTVVWRRSKPTVTQVFLTAIVVPLNKRACISSHSSRFLLRPLLIFTIYSSSSSSALLSSYFWISRAIFFLPFVHLFASRSLSLNYLLFFSSFFFTVASLYPFHRFSIHRFAIAIASPSIRSVASLYPFHRFFLILFYLLFLIPRFHSTISGLSSFPLSLLSLFYLCSILFSSFLAFTLLSPFPRFSFQFLSCSLCLFSSFLKYCRFLRFSRRFFSVCILLFSQLFSASF